MMKNPTTLWNDLNHILHNTFFLKNIFLKIIIFQFSGYNNSSNSNHHLLIYYFSVSPFNNNVNTDKITLTNYTIIHYTLDRYTNSGKEIIKFCNNIDIDIDPCLLPSFSLITRKEISGKFYKIFKSATCYPFFLTYFEYYNALVKKHFTYRNSPVQNDVLKYCFTLFLLFSNKNHFMYNKNTKTNLFAHNINIFRYKNIAKNNYNIKKNSINVFIKWLKVQVKPKNYSFLLKFIVGPFFLFELPFIFFLEAINYSKWNLFIYLPFMFYMWFLRYFYHRKHMVTELIRKRHKWTHFRNDWSGVRWRPRYFRKNFYVMMPANKYKESWVWGRVHTYYPYKGGDCVLW